jgi:hypothetical protein
MATRRRIFATGQSVSQSGHYQVSHRPHLLRSEISLLKGNYFPACAKCTVPVQFELTQGLRVESSRERFRLLTTRIRVPSTRL